MSLFPAYEGNQSSSTNSLDAKKEWLENKSFPSQIVTEQKNQENDNRTRGKNVSGSPEETSSSTSRDSSRERNDRKRSYSPKRRRYSSSDSRDGLSEARKRERGSSRDRKRSKKSRQRSNSPRRHSRSRTRSRSSSRSHRKSRKSEKKSRSSKKSKKTKEKRLTKEELIAKFSTRKTFLEEVDLRPEDAFREDRLGNRQLVKFRFLPVSETPHFRVRWKREVLSNVATVKSTFDHKSYRFFRKEYQKAFLGSDDVTNLSSFLKRNQQLETPTTKLKFSTRNDQQTKKDDDSATFDGFSFDEIQEKTKVFNEKLRKNPFNDKLWLEFIDFQDEVLRGSHFEGENVNSKKEEKKKFLPRATAVAEKKLAVLQTALKDNPNSSLLLAKRLKILAAILDPEKLDSEWRELISRFPSNVTLWKSYLRFLSTRFSNFSVRKMIESLSDSMDNFSKMSNLNEDHIFFFIHLAAHLWSTAGYRERGVGLYQALLELNFCSGSSKGAMESLLPQFEQFWDCSAPRFGEKGAIGWFNIIRSKVLPSDENSESQSNYEDGIIAEAGGRVPEAKLWLAIEIHRELTDWLPYRSFEEEPTDPDRCVSFDDIRPFLFLFDKPASKFKLLTSFLKYLGCDFKKIFASYSEFTNLETESMEAWLGFTAPEAIPYDMEGSVLQQGAPNLTDNAQLESFVRSIFKQGLKSLEEPLKTHFCVLWINFEQYLIKQDANSATRKNRLKEFKSSVKKILETDRNNVIVYCAYALALAKLESFQSGKKIIDALLTADKTAIVFRTAIAIELDAFKNISHGTTDDDDVTGAKHLDEALWLLCLMATGDSYRQSDLSKLDSLSFAHETKKFLELKLCDENREFQYDGPALRDASPVIFQSKLFDDILCYVWLSAILSGDVTDTETLLNSCCDKIRQNEKSFDNKVFCEHLDVKLRLDVLSTQKLAPTLIRSSLKRLIDVYPKNPVVLKALKDKIQVRPSVADSFWRCLVKSFSCNKASPHGLIFIVKDLLGKFIETCQVSEIHLQGEALSTAYLNKAIAILEAALKNDNLKPIVAIWRLLLWATKALVSQSTKNSGALSVKNVFYRSIQECPSAKILYLDLMSFTDFDENNLQSELEDILNEKEVRVRLPMDELRVLLEPEEHQLSD